MKSKIIKTIIYCILSLICATTVAQVPPAPDQREVPPAPELCEEPPAPDHREEPPAPERSEERDSIFAVQFVKDSFTQYGIPDVYITLADEKGVLINTIWTEDGNGSHGAKIWGMNFARKAQSFIVKAEHPDYETVVQHLEIKNPGRLQEYKFPDLLMKRKMRETSLNEVTVTATRVQLIHKGDTIVVDAQAFKIPEGSMLDALVANVPGAELKDDGTIYMNGRKVDYLTLNGKDFFKGKNRIMLDNLPYYVVNKLKFYEKDMPRSQMMHSDTGKKDYVMDVELKQEYSIGYTANIEAGIGTNEKWMGRLFGLRFTDNSRMVLFGGANNINEVRPPGAEGWNAQSKMITGEKEKEMVGGNFSVYDKKGRYNENLEVIVNWSGDKDESRTSKETFLTGNHAFSKSQDVTESRDFAGSLSNKWELKKAGLLFDTNVSYERKKGNGFSRSASFASDPSSFGTCVQVLDSIFSLSVNPLLKNIGVNKVYDQTRYNSTGVGFNQSVNWDKSLPWGDDIAFFARVDYDKDSKEDFSLYNLSFPKAGSPQEKQNRYNPYDRHGYSYEFQGAYYLHLPRNWNLGWTSRYSQQYDNTESSLYRLDRLDYNMEFGMLPSQAEYLRTIDVGNSYRSLRLAREATNEVNISHSYYCDKYSLFFMVAAPVCYHNDGIRYWRSNQQHDLNKYYWYVEPRARVEYNRNSLNVMSYWFEYSTSVQTPNLIQLLDVTDTTNPLSINTGNPNLQASRIHHLELHMDNGNWKKFFNVDLSANVLDNMVANGFTYNPVNGVYTHRPENVKGNWNAEAKSSYNTFLDKEMRYKIEGRTSFNYVHNVDLAQVEGFNASQLSRVNHYITSQHAKVSYNKESLRVELGGDFSWNVAVRDWNNFGNINAFDFSYGLSGQYTFPWEIQFSTSLKMYSRRGYNESSMNDNELIWNASVSRPFMKGRLVVKVEGFDLLRQRSATHYTINGQGRTETWQLSMPRYAMLRVSYKLNKQPRKK